MKHLNQGQGFAIIGVAALLLVSFLFPPWVCRLGSHPIFESAGYKFILTPPGCLDVSIDLLRLLIQSVVIVLAGFIGFCLSAWKTPRDTPIPPIRPLPGPKYGKYQEIIIVCSGILILVSVLFPPWIGPMSTYRTEHDFKDRPKPRITVKLLEDAGFSRAEIEDYLSRGGKLDTEPPRFKNQEEELEWLNRETKAGRLFKEGESKFFNSSKEPKVIYRFILNPPEEGAVSINFKKLILQIMGFFLAGGLSFLAVGWLFPQTSEKETSPNRPIPTSFKTKEEYEQWKSNRLGLSLQKEVSDPRSISKQRSMLSVKKIPTRWLSFYTYLYLPFTVLTSFIPVLAQYQTLIDKGFSVRSNPSVFSSWANQLEGTIVWAAFVCVTIYGLHKRQSWSWFCNWIILSAIVLVNPILYAEGIGSYLITATLLGIVFFVPNYIYFKKRRVLFLEKPGVRRRTIGNEQRASSELS